MTRGHDDEPSGAAYDIVTPTAQERRRAELASRRRRYVLLMVPCIAMVLFGFFVPAPTPVRVAVLCVAAVLVPVAAALGSGGLRP